MSEFREHESKLKAMVAEATQLAPDQIEVMIERENVRAMRVTIRCKVRSIQFFGTMQFWDWDWLPQPVTIDSPVVEIDFRRITQEVQIGIGKRIGPILKGLLERFSMPESRTEETA